MRVLLVLLGSTLLFRALGLAGVKIFAMWLSSARASTAVMFLFTAVSHFAPMKKDLIAMVPPTLPRPDLLVLTTGFAEVFGAIGLLIPVTRYWAACGLIALLVAIVPANIGAAQRRILLRGRPVTPLWLRLPMQIMFVIWVWGVR